MSYLQSVNGFNLEMHSDAQWPLSRISGTDDEFYLAWQARTTSTC